MGTTLSSSRNSPSSLDTLKSSKQLFQLVDWTDTSNEKTFYDSNGNVMRRGDMLAFHRGAFQHYALYLGKGMVIHVTPDKSSNNRKVVVLIESLEDVQKGSKVEIRNHDDKAVDKYEAPPRSFEAILEAAKPHVGEEINYDLVFNNCEHYCTLWRYGVKFSTQVRKGVDPAGVFPTW